MKLSLLKRNLPEFADFKLSNFQKQGLHQVADSIKTALVFVYDYRRKGEIAPLTYLKENIAEIILNRRRFKLLDDVKDEIFEEGTLKQKYEIYENF